MRAQASFRPEFLNRVDETVVFHELTRDDIHAIVNIQVTQLNERLAEHGVSTSSPRPLMRCWCKRAMIRSLGRGRCAGPFSG